jgi:hypothetical protein
MPPEGAHVMAPDVPSCEVLIVHRCYKRLLSSLEHPPSKGLARGVSAGG